MKRVAFGPSRPQSCCCRLWAAWDFYFLKSILLMSSSFRRTIGVDNHVQTKLWVKTRRKISILAALSATFYNFNETKEENLLFFHISPPWSCIVESFAPMIDFRFGVKCYLLHTHSLFLFYGHKCLQAVSLMRWDKHFQYWKLQRFLCQKCDSNFLPSGL